MDPAHLEELLDYSELIDALDNGFRKKITVPQRHHYHYESDPSNQPSTLLLMPAWENEHRLGVKVITVSPDNAKLDLPAIQGSYVLMNAKNGLTLKTFEAAFLTACRTACSSALASRYISDPDSESLLMIGTGALSKHLICAHAAVRPIKRVFVWGRDIRKAQKVADQFKGHSFTCEAVESKEEYIPQVDIISCATLSPTPLINGELLVKAQHIDLVGAYLPTSRESDDTCILRSDVFVDHFTGIRESGDIKIPMDKGILKKEDIMADLFALSQGQKVERQKEISLFKSVGHAMEDLVTASYFYDKSH